MNAVTGGGYGMQKTAKKNAQAQEAMAKAMEKAPVAQSSKVAEQQTQNTQTTEQSVNGDAKRRSKISNTVNHPMQSLSGLRKTLG